MKRFVLALLMVLALATAAAYAAPIVACGNVECDHFCVGDCGTSSGLTFTGMCIAGSPTRGCTYSRCSGSTAVCAGGPFGKSGCSSDSECDSGQVCVSDSGTSGCGLGWAQCMTVCTTSTTTSTSTTTTTTTSTTTTT